MIKTSPFGVRVTGPLASFHDGFCRELARRGYTPLSAANQVRVFAHLSRWMGAEGLVGSALSEDRVIAFLEYRRAQGYTGWLSLQGLGPSLEFLRVEGVVPGVVVAVVEGPIEELLEGYRRHLVQERGLAVSTVARYVSTARWFLTSLRSQDVAGLSAADVRGFVLAECPGRSVGLAKNIVAEVRSLLRFLFAVRLISADLAASVPAVAGWRGSSLPKALDAGVVADLLRACEGHGEAGRRDLAVLVVLSRLGLRAGEVAGLSLDDIDWVGGEVTVCGKGTRYERLPLPVDVGEVIVDYLRHDRPESKCRAVFLCARAPHGAMSGSAVTAVVRRAGLRAGVGPIGAHRLRHTTATEMLRAGAGLGEVGQVLRHRSPATTAIYAKTDIEALRALALPWPEVAS